MNTGIAANLVGAIIVSVPLIIAAGVRHISNRRKPRPSATDAERKSRFGLCYLVIQLLINGLAISEGISSTGTEDAPVWGLSTLTTWGAAVFITPLLAILLDMMVQITGGIIRKIK